MYSFHAYGMMLADRLRREAFLTALRVIVRPGATVLELGAGPGIFAVIAAMRGAGKVYAVDPSPYVNLVTKAATLNALGDRLDVHRCRSTDWTPDQSIDVVLHDLRGTLPYFEGNLRTLRDLRTRCAPTARFIPRRDRVYAALVSCPERWSELIDVWTRCDDGVNASTYVSMAVNTWYRTAIDPSMIISDAELLVTLDYEADFDLDLHASASWAPDRVVRADGVAAWFEADLADDVHYTSGPENPASAYGQAFFPFREPLTLQPGDHVRWTIRAIDIKNDYLWLWTTRVEHRDGSVLTLYQGGLAGPLSLRPSTPAEPGRIVRGQQEDLIRR